MYIARAFPVAVVLEWAMYTYTAPDIPLLYEVLDFVSELVAFIRQ